MAWTRWKFGSPSSIPIPSGSMAQTSRCPIWQRRARALHAAFSELRSEVLQVVADTDSVAVAFVMHGRHTGPYETAFGTLQSTGSDVQIRTIDVLTINGGKISTVWVNADDLGTLQQLGWRGV